MATWKKVITTADDAEYKNSNISGLKQEVHMQWSMRWYTQASPTNTGPARRKWYGPSTTYGPSYYQWSSSYTGVNPRSTWYDFFNPCIVIPSNMTLKSYRLYGNSSHSSSSAGDFLLNLKKNTSNINWANVDYPTGIPLSTVGSTQTESVNGNRLFMIGENVDESCNKGDILIPALCRDFNLTTTLYYFIEGVFTLVFEKDI